MTTSPAAELFSTQWLDLPIGRTRVRTLGAGPVVLFSHGAVVDGRFWDGVARLVAQAGYRTVLPDLPLGAHTVPVADRSGLDPARVASALFEVADALAIDAFTLVGCDTGGAVAQLATAARPDRIERLVLLSSDAFEHFPPTRFKPFQWAARSDITMRLALRLLSSARWQRRWLPLGWIAKQPLDPALVASWAAPAACDRQVRADLAALVRSMDPADTLGAAAVLASYPGPALVAWSRLDRVFPASDAERLVATLPDARLVWIDDSYTFAPLDQPVAVAAAIVAFLAEVTTG